MATLALAVAGSVIGGAAFPAGVSVLGATLTGAGIGSQIGAVAGSIVDQALLGGRTRNVEGPRLTELHITASTEGAPIPRIYGRARLGGQVIWATPFEEEVATSSSGGGKGLSGSAARRRRRSTATMPTSRSRSREGQISGIGRRVGGRAAARPARRLRTRVYVGNETQEADR